MIRFSDIIDDINLDVEDKDTEGAGMALGKTDFWNTGRVEGRNTMEDARAYYQNLLALADEVQRRVQGNETINISSVIHQLRHIIENDLIESLYYYLIIEWNKDGGVAEHSIDVTIFSLMVGIGMGYDKSRLLPLAMVAFLHDVGMHKVPQEILKKRGKLSDQELKEVQKHPIQSAEILSQLGDRFTWLVNLCLLVHERADGSGYPRGLKEGNTHNFAFIVGLVDIYSAMIKDRPYRNRIEKNNAMKSILASSKGKFPYKIIKVFLNQISFFPVGSYVKLSNYSAGRVISTNPNFPLKPTVEILYDHIGNKLKRSKIIDLSQEPLIYVIESIDEKEFI